MAVNLKTLETKAKRVGIRDTAGELTEYLSRYRQRPIRYASEYLGQYVTPKQAEILRALQKPPYRVLARSANTQGKTFVAALKCSHFYDTEKPSVTLATAPVRDQVRDLLFKELRRIRPNSRGFLPKATRLEGAPDHYVHGLTANSPDAFQGRHEAAVGLLFDEATGVHRDFWMRGETMFESTGQHWWLACYNPNDSSSYAYTAEETGTWTTIQLSALEHPNILAELEGLPPPVPGAVRLDTIIRRMIAECEIMPAGMHDTAMDFNFPVGSPHWWRPKTPDFEAQIIGRWPISPTTALWSPIMFELCCRPALIDSRWSLAIGCDVARFGDDKTVIVVRRGPVVLAIFTYSGVNTTWIANRLREVANEFLMGDEDREILAPRVPIYIDDTGGYGAGVIDQAKGYNFVGLNMSSMSADPRFPNLRSQIWCMLADAAHHDVVNFSRLTLEQRRILRSELTSARYKLDSQGRRAMEPKAHIKERLGRSPDTADAVCLAYSLAAE